MDKKTKNIIVAAIGGLVLVGGGVGEVDENINVYEETQQEFVATLDGSGEKVVVSKDEPAISFEKWDGEAKLGVSYPSVSDEGKRKVLSNKIEWKNEKEIVHAYPLEANESMEGGGFEIELILKEKPDTNIFTFPLNGYESFDFYYQPELTQQEIDEGSIRPENIVGSYAVYHKELKNNKYTTGKAFHIFRPLVKDADGDQVWGTLMYVDGALSVTVPQEYLDKAVYPVSVDPTVGFTSIGGTSGGNTANDHFVSVLESVPSSGTITSISIYFSSVGATEESRAGVYDTGLALLATSTEVSVNSAGAWFVHPINVSISGGVSYHLSYLSDRGATPSYLLNRYDENAASPAVETNYSPGQYPVLPNPKPTSIGRTRDYSMFATYTDPSFIGDF